MVARVLLLLALQSCPHGLDWQVVSTDVVDWSRPAKFPRATGVSGGKRPPSTLWRECRKRLPFVCGSRVGGAAGLSRHERAVPWGHHLVLDIDMCVT
jgi:hypothetical protein